MDQGITFLGVPTKITTTADGGWRISFDVSANETSAIQRVADFRDELCQVAILLAPENAAFASENDLNEPLNG